MAVRSGLHGARLITALIAAFIFGCWMQFFIWHNFISPLEYDGFHTRAAHTEQHVNLTQKSELLSDRESNRDPFNKERDINSIPVMHWSKGAVAYYNRPELWPQYGDSESLEIATGLGLEQGSDPLRIIIATIPRSGNGWIRGMLEAVSGIATSSIYAEIGTTFSNHTHSYYQRCGWLNDCNVVRHPSGNDPILIKTHFPFLQATSSVSPTNKHDDVGFQEPPVELNTSTSYTILPVRNPLDNFEAWMRYVRQRNTSTRQEVDPHQNLPAFMKAWASHVDFWCTQPIPMVVYRYEDFVEHPLATLSAILRASGLWAQLGVRDLDLLRVSRIGALHSYRRRQVGNAVRAGKRDDVTNAFQKHSKRDIQYVLDHYRPLLSRYGYDDMYEWWLRAKDAIDSNTTLDSDSFAKMLGRHRHDVAVAEDWRDVVSPIRRAASALGLRMVQQGNDNVGVPAA
eukprot:m.167201 g.167201  ORF g.167201 m.167201 type:complete len:455 (+) comp18186_c0_seq2:406-1770(+)